MRIRIVVFTLIFLCAVRVSFSQQLLSEKIVSNDSLHVKIQNQFLAPVTFTLKAKKAYKGKVDCKKKFVLNHMEWSELCFSIPMSLLKDTSSFEISTFFEAKYLLGDSKSCKPDKNYAYEFPFLKGKKYRVMQGFHGSFSHSEKSSEYAVDVALAIGDTVCAAREGIVIMVIKHNSEHGKSKEYIDKANKVVIYHSDGTFAHYAHLAKNGVFVKVGDQVKVGNVLGTVGMTGFTTAPHLHFVIFGKNNKSIPFQFKNFKVKNIEMGMYLKH